MAVALLHVRAGRDVNEKSEQRTYHGDQAREGEVLPWVMGGDLAVRHGGEGVGEYVDEGCGEDNSGGEALDQEDGLVVEGFSLEEAGEEHRRRYA